MQRWALPLLLLAGITGVLLLIFAGQPHAGRSDPGSADAGQSPLVTGDPLPGSGAAPGSGTQEPGSIQRTNTDPTLPPSAPGNTDLIEIQVLRRADGAPVPEAEVLVLDLSEKQEKEAAEAFFVGVTVDGFLEKFGQKHQADASGIARIPKPSGDSVLMARKGPLFGLIQWSKLELRRVPGQPVRIEVEESSDLRIRVKDESGRPVAADVVRGRSNPPRGWQSRYYAEKRPVPSLATTTQGPLPTTLVSLLRAGPATARVVAGRWTVAGGEVGVSFRLVDGRFTEVAPTPAAGPAP